ncbi:hypothetical protein Z052_08770 [Halorubrum sp. C191]|nr:hypothetical protein Z052_08770 [Halorubrum sp. C191]
MDFLFSLSFDDCDSAGLSHDSVCWVGEELDDLIDSVVSRAVDHVVRRRVASRSLLRGSVSRRAVGRGSLGIISAAVFALIDSVG